MSVNDAEFAAAAAAHCADQTDLLDAAVQRLIAKAEKFEELAVITRSSVDVARAAADAARAEAAEWAEKAQGPAPAPAETVYAEAGSAVGSGEAVL